MNNDSNDNKRWEVERAFDAAAGIYILSVLREYNEKVVPLIDEYVSSVITTKRFLKSTPGSKIRRIISDEIKMAMDHLGRASVRSTYDETENQIRLSRWHLDQVQILTLIPLTRHLRVYIEYLIVRPETRQAIDNTRFQKITRERDAVLVKLRNLMGELKKLQNENRSPEPNEMENTRALTNELYDIYTSYDEMVTVDKEKKIGPFRSVLLLLRRIKIRRDIIAALIFFILAAGLKIEADNIAKMSGDGWIAWLLLAGSVVMGIVSAVFVTLFGRIIWERIAKWWLEPPG